MLPAWTERAFQVSPFTHVIWLYRDVVLGDVAHPASWFMAPAMGLFCLLIGYRIFRSLRHMFGDAL
jgi:homopolymeric O-antigen transport system permease protein